MLKIINGKIITPYQVISNGSLLIKDGIIQEVSAGNIEAGEATELDVKGHYIAPGFIDLHVHGGGGHDFMDNSAAAFLGIAATHAKYGTTSMYPTTLSSGKEDMLRCIEVYNNAEKINNSGSQ